MKKSFCLMLFGLLVSLAGSAKSLVFTLSDGSKVTYALTRTETVKMSVTDGTVVVNADNYSFSDIVSFRLSKQTPTAIESPTDAPIRQGDIITFATGGTVSVYKVSGERVANSTSGSIDLSTLPSGTYIVKSGSNAIKVTKR